ncbi:hypothetical protein [Mycolicibacterium iranicum]|uniref:General stress protein CsbD n=1 Tax=Mycolicibacterium iranicum TaxID=912594 RepID=A0A178LZ67_MYCIR|nr:hypothetical protein [Mycolicibacterium iranicum]OAN39914.1 general stress protein CsbD [Mycolicibacterium iranicum]
MNSDDKSQEARQGLLDSVKGKAKEVAGAVIGNDSLTKEGQLEQAQARQRKEANITEAVADAEIDETRAELAEARSESAQARAEVDTEAAAAKGAIQARQQDEKRIAEQQRQKDVAAAAAAAQVETQRDIQEAKAREDVEKEAAQEDLVEAAAEHDTAVKVTDNAKAEAERLREHADEISARADLP